MLNANTPAAPSTEWRRSEAGKAIIDSINHPGLSKRELFALECLKAIMFKMPINDYSMNAEKAVKQADLLLSELDKTNQK